MNTNAALLKGLIKLLADIYGTETVYKAALLQGQLVMVDRLAASMSGSIRIDRIKVVRATGIVSGLREAKDWVEEHFADTGKGDPL